MKLHMDSGDSSLRITGYDGNSVTVAERRLTASFAVTPENLFDDLGTTSFEALSWSGLAELHELDIEILVLGTGSMQRFPAPPFFAELASAGVGLEVMDNGAACRTYNILASEGRRVAAVLLLESR